MIKILEFDAVKPEEVFARVEPTVNVEQIVSDIKNVEDPIQIYHLIVDSIPMKYFDGRKTKKIERKGKKQVILSCYLEG